MLDAIIHGISVLIWWVGALLCQLLDLIYSMFRVFAGIDAVTLYVSDGAGGTKPTQDYLINVFFANSTITKVYWGMAIIGIAMTFGFAVWSVVKKMFDSNDKVKNSYSGILTNCFKAILIICLMSAIVSATINCANILMEQITYVFDNGEKLGEADEIDFDQEDYATMFRVLNTVGNYAVNPSKDTRYNINTCFNEIRQDLQRLDAKGVLDFDYKYVMLENDDGGNTETALDSTWQSALVKIAGSHSIYQDLNLDTYYPSVEEAILECMDLINNDASFAPIQSTHYDRVSSTTTENATPGKIVMLAGSMNAAYEEIGKSGSWFFGIGAKEGKGVKADAGVTDSIRMPFYNGSRDIYDQDEVEDQFDIDFGKWNHILVILGSFFLIKEFAACLLNCVARIFNMMLLYLVSPLVISVYPLDEGGKFKQWSTAFIVQSFSVFGTVIAIRILMLFVPVVMSASLVIFDDPFMNLAAKIVLIMGAGLTAEKASSLITGILADNAGMAALQAGDIGNTARAAVSAGRKIATGIASTAAGHAAGAVGSVTGLTALSNKVSQGVRGAADGFTKGGGLPGMLFRAITSKSDGGSNAGAAGGSDGGSDNNAPGNGGPGGLPNSQTQGGGGADGNGANLPGSKLGMGNDQKGQPSAGGSGANKELKESPYLPPKQS